MGVGGGGGGGWVGWGVWREEQKRFNIVLILLNYHVWTVCQL